MMDLPKEKARVAHAYLIEGDVKNNFEEIKTYFSEVFGIRDVNTDVDVTVLSAETMDVQKVRETIRTISIKPHGDSKIYLILEAQHLSLTSQNALLKTLEEPPDYAFFFLLVDNSLSVLSTLRSRCILCFTGYDKKEESIYPEEEQLLFFKMAEQKDALGMRHFFLPYFSKREELIHILESLVFLSARLLKEGYMRREVGSEVQFPRYKLIRMFDLLQETKTYIDANVNAKTSIDLMILTILEGED